MTFFILVGEANPAAIEWMTNRLFAEFPNDAFALTVNVDDPTMVILRMWESSSPAGIYAFPRRIFVRGDPREVEMVVNQYITFVRAHLAQRR